VALLCAATVAAGCGLGPGKEVGRVSLTVTRDFGAGQVVPRASEDVTEADTVMRVLERNAQIETRYSGGFVQSIEGLEADEEGGGPQDWFFYVNGVESTVGAAQYPLHGGESIWWDYHDWGSAIHIPAVVGSYPEPFRDGYEGQRHPVSVVCRASEELCGEVSHELEREGVPVAGAGASVDGIGGPAAGAIRVLVGTWARLKSDPAAAQIDRGPQASGVFAKLEEGGACRLQALDESGGVSRRFAGDAGLIAATRRYESPPTWVVTGCSPSGVGEAAWIFDRPHLRDHFAVIAVPGPKVRALPLPVPGG
jgi:hypothetical protein